MNITASARFAPKDALRALGEHEFSKDATSGQAGRADQCVWLLPGAASIVSNVLPSYG
ncbi:hypothetical protein [Craterilacuibacter sp.]|uniref:hypothetical protein n=1 Tax=Craterilacuibacter sp. TaxID=2870909 RepID=UPI003F403E28